MNKYKISVEDLSGTYPHPLTFEASNHDDIFKIVEKLPEKGFSTEEAASLGVGLKLFSEVMLKNKDNTLFSSFIPHFIDFMKELKK